MPKYEITPAELEVLLPILNTVDYCYDEGEGLSEWEKAYNKTLKRLKKKFGVQE